MLEGGPGRAPHTHGSTRAANVSSMAVSGKSAKPSIRSVAPAFAYAAIRSTTASGGPASTLPSSGCSAPIPRVARKRASAAAAARGVRPRTTSTSTERRTSPGARP
ncbi:MAG TPA: hypothetical protein DDZ42_03880 [Candidatus Rokubacteria bacterium]|nr:hypothetical protein [Candidatus Rokubacteria bacterium]